MSAKGDVPLIPLKDVHEADILDEDILLGRGGKTNHHIGNARYLKIIEARQVKYMLIGSRPEKTAYAMSMVKELRAEGSRFLKKDAGGKLWSDVGDAKMREKVSQNLREHQPKLKEQLGVDGCGGGTSPAAQEQAPTAPIKQELMFTNQPQMWPQQLQLLQCQMPQQAQMQQQAQEIEAFAQQQLLQSQMMQQQQQQLQGMSSVGSRQFSNCGQQVLNIPKPSLTASTSNEPIPYTAGGVVIQEDAPPSYAWSGDLDRAENELLNSVGADCHRLASLSMLPEIVENTLTLGEENSFRDARAFSKQQDFADRDAGHQSSSTISAEELPMSSTFVDRPCFGDRLQSIGDIDITAVMGESTQSLLDSLRVDAVPEDGEYVDEEPLSPQPNMLQNSNSGQYTPVLDNRRTINSPFGDPATITPTGLSPVQPGEGVVAGNVLDSDALDVWASSYGDKESGQVASNPFSFAGGPAFPFRRNNTSPAPNSTGGKPATFRRSHTNPGPGGGSPFGASNGCPEITARRLPRMARTYPGRPQSPTREEQELSPRPNSLTLNKRETSNVNETPDTRAHLVFQEPSLGPGSDPIPSGDNLSGSVSSFASSVKKASLGRDMSAQSRALKQQYMPHAFGSLSSHSTTTVSTAPMSSSDSITNGWPTAPSTSPIMSHSTGNGDTTPKTGKMLLDFGKMGFSGSDNRSPTRTAGNFEDTLAKCSSQSMELAHKNPLNLMVNKPDRLMWRNRTSTIEALDLDSLDDDPVLNGERGKRRASRSSINEVASMWANMPSSDEFDDLVSDIAGRPVSDLLDQPPLGPTTPKAFSLALPF